MRDLTRTWRARALELSFYDQWLEKENIPVYRTNWIEDIHALDLGQWERIGGRGAYLQMGGQIEFNGYVVEIAAGGNLHPERHMYEEIMYVLSGSGAAEVWQEGGRRHRFEWTAGSLFAMPLNAWHQLFNGSGSQPARLMAATTAPRILNQFHNERFVFENPFIFNDRFDGSDDDYFSHEGSSWGPRSWETNFVPDVRAVRLEDWEEKGVGTRHMRFVMTDAVYGCHVHELSPLTYVQAHRHQPGAMILMLEGSGYEVMWLDGQPKQRYELKPGTVVSPGNMMYHQHMNPNPAPMRQLAFRGRGFSKYGTGEGGAEVHMTQLVRYEDEDPGVREEFYAECRRRGYEPVLLPVRQ